MLPGIQSAENITTNEHDESDLCSESLALAQVIGYIENVKFNEVKFNEVTLSVFKLSKMTKLYASQLGISSPETRIKVHATGLKECLLQNFPDLTAVSHGRDVLLNSMSMLAWLYIT